MEFDWDAANEEHIALHGVTPEEAEEAVTDPSRVATGAYRAANSERCQGVVGRTGEGRMLTVILTRRGDLARVVTAREANKTGAQRLSKGEHMIEMTMITDLNQIPAFGDEAEEAMFWSTHALAPHLLTADNASDLLPPVRSRKSNPTSLRLSAELESRLRHLAQLKGTSYQTLLKEFVLERVYEEEKRLRVI